MSVKIFVRERHKVEKGDKKPRYKVVCATGDITFTAEHLRKIELDAIAKELGGEVVYLPKGGEGEYKEG